MSIWESKQNLVTRDECQNIHWSNLSDCLISGRHAHSRLVLHEPETPAEIYQENNENQPSRQGLQGQGRQGNVSRRGETLEKIVPKIA